MKHQSVPSYILKRIMFPWEKKRENNLWQLVIGIEKFQLAVWDDPKLPYNSGVLPKGKPVVDSGLICVCEASTPPDANLAMSSKRLLMCAQKKGKKEVLIVCIRPHYFVICSVSYQTFAQHTVVSLREQAPRVHDY